MLMLPLWSLLLPEALLVSVGRAAVGVHVGLHVGLHASGHCPWPVLFWESVLMACTAPKGYDGVWGPGFGRGCIMSVIGDATGGQAEVLC